MISLFAMVFTVLLSTVSGRAIPMHAKRATTPSNYNAGFSNIMQVVPQAQALSVSAYMPTFDPSVCSSVCDNDSKCNSFNIYVTNSPSVGVYCAYFSKSISATEATSQTTASGQLVHQSYGYVKKVQILYSSSSSITYSSMTNKPLTTATVTQGQGQTSQAGLTTSQSANYSPTTSSFVSSTVSTAVFASATATGCSVPNSMFADWCGSEFEANIEAALADKLSNIKTKNFIIPLYLYPAFWTTPGTWDWVISAIKANSNTIFTIIINPSDGPGVDSAGAAPDDYATGIAALRAAGKNVKILGYVDTNLGARAKSDVLGDIKVYASWTSSKIDGIFFDRQATASSKVSLYTTYAKAVKAASWYSSNPTIGSNPSGVCDQKYLSLFDFIVIYNDSADNLDAAIFGNYESFLAAIPEAQLSKLAWFVSEATTATARTAVLNLQAGLEAGRFYISDKTADQASMAQIDTAVFNAALKQVGTPTFS